MWPKRIDADQPIDHNDHYDHNDEYKGKMMITQTSAVAFRQNLGEMLNQVQYRHDSVVINKDGKPWRPWSMRACSSVSAASRNASRGFASESKWASKRFPRQTAYRKSMRRSHLNAPRIAHHHGVVESPMATLRVVFDTNVLLSGIAYPASIPGKVMAAWRHGGMDRSR
jgi:hypothetical protein